MRVYLDLFLDGYGFGYHGGYYGGYRGFGGFYRPPILGFPLPLPIPVPFVSYGGTGNENLFFSSLFQILNIYFTFFPFSAYYD